MPIEIRELNIKVNIGNKQEEQFNSAAQGEDAPDVEQEELVAMIIEQVLEIINNQKER